MVSRMKTLHTADRVTDLAASLVFYAALGYQEVGRVDLGDGASLTMLKFPEEDRVSLELLHRPEDGSVDVGTSHLVVQVENLPFELVEWPRGHPDGITADDFV